MGLTARGRLESYLRLQKILKMRAEKDKAQPDPSLSVASGCSQGGEQKMEIPDRSHDSALSDERRRFWRASFEYRRQDEPRETVKDLCKYADVCLREYDERFGETASAPSRVEKAG